MSAATTGAEARHHIANLLHSYTEIADRKDVAAGVALLGDAVVTFPAGGFADRAGAAAFLSSLWGSDIAHRHDVTNLVVERESGSEDGALWRARAHYARWVFTPDPVLHTLGNYDLLVDGDTWRVLELTVRRSWTIG